MIIRYNGEEAVNLPDKSIIEEILEPSIANRLFDVLSLCVSKELEVYRQQPRAAFGDASKKDVVKTFDPTDNRTCFMGSKFNNDESTSYVLDKYRKAIGTIVHPVWGKATLLEIWGADHFKDHPEMVTEAFKYGYGLTKEKPAVVFFINPLFQNKATGVNARAEETAAYKDEMDRLLAEAIVFGTKAPKEKRVVKRKKL